MLFRLIYSCFKQEATKICLEAKSRYENDSQEYISFIDSQPEFLQCFSARYNLLKIIIKLVCIKNNVTKYPLNRENNN